MRVGSIVRFGTKLFGPKLNLTCTDNLREKKAASSDLPLDKDGWSEILASERLFA